MKKSAMLLGAAMAALHPLCSVSAVLTAVPMQGGMVMPLLMYQADHGRLQVTMTTEIPALTPLLVSNPADRFDPADPWYAALDPGAGGGAFSRRYGFLWDSAMSDPLPANTQVWLRKLSSTPGLDVYRYSGNPPKAFEPIFGTHGAPDARQWNLMMFHPCFVAPPGATTHQAVFEAHLVDAGTGLEVPLSGTGPFTFDFINLPDGRPVLKMVTVAGQMAVTWPAGTSANWILESAETPGAAIWEVITDAPVEVEGQPAVMLDGHAPHRVFRMRHSP
jgi:hypothetical protein